MSKHPIEIQKYQGTIRQLASEIGDLRYDVLSEFLDCLADEIYGDSERDKQRGRKKLAQALREAANDIAESKTKIDEAWKISKPFELK
jgi:hypothetical protein